MTLSGLGLRPRPPRRDATSPVPRQRPRRLVSNSPPPRDAPIGRGGSSPTHRAASTRRAGAGDGPFATRSLPPKARCERAVEHLEQTRHRTRPDIDQYNQARSRVEETQTALDRHDSRVCLRHTLDQVPVLRRQIEGLELWSRWARGDTINVQQLGDTIAQLTSHSRRDEHADQFRALGQAANDWADDAGIDLPTRGRHTRTARTSRARTRPVSATNVPLDPVARDRSKRRRSPDRPEAGESPRNRARRSPQTHEIGPGGTNGAEHSARIRD